MERLARFGYFVAGAASIALLMGTVGYVTAASDDSITACAHKSTGVIRLAPSGKCKKSENRLTWNRQGPIGERGPQGAQGLTGQTAVSSNTDLFVFDAQNRNLGPLVSSDQFSGQIVLWNNSGLWSWEPYTNKWGNSQHVAYRDSNCSVPLLVVGESDGAIPNVLPSWVRFVERPRGQGGVWRAFKSVGEPFLASSVSTKYRWDEMSSMCTVASNGDFFSNPASGYFSEAVSVELPTIDLPLRISER